jgi:hypothetical protein
MALQNMSLDLEGNERVMEVNKEESEWRDSWYQSRIVG